LKRKQIRATLNNRALEILSTHGDDEIASNPELLDAIAQYSGKGGVEAHLNEYYTDPRMAQAILSILLQLGYVQPLCLEPSCGTGRFIAHASKKYLFHGIEVDPTSSRIATILHPNSYIENIDFRKFAMLRLKNGKQPEVYDAIVGNPPFGTFTVNPDELEVTNYGREGNRNRLECFFVEECLKMLKPGGILAMVLPYSCLSGKSLLEWRKRLAALGGVFLGAMRFPEGVHDDTAVVTDAFFMMKGPRSEGRGTQQPFALGNWFLDRDNQKFILGKEAVKMRYGKEIYTVVGDLPKDLSGYIGELVDRMKRQIAYFRLRPSNSGNEVALGDRTARMVKGEWEIDPAEVSDLLPNVEIAQLLEMDFPSLEEFARGDVNKNARPCQAH